MFSFFGQSKKQDCVIKYYYRVKNKGENNTFQKINDLLVLSKKGAENEEGEPFLDDAQLKEPIEQNNTFDDYQQEFEIFGLGVFKKINGIDVFIILLLDEKKDKLLSHFIDNDFKGSPIYDELQIANSTIYTDPEDGTISYTIYRKDAYEMFET